jgi:hypothetical protein
MIRRTLFVVAVVCLGIVTGCDSKSSGKTSQKGNAGAPEPSTVQLPPIPDGAPRVPMPPK